MKRFNRIIDFLKQSLLEIGDTRNILQKGMQYWRELIFSYILSGMLILGFIALIPSAWLSFRNGQYGLVAFDFAAYGLVASQLIFRKRIPYTFRAWFVLIMVSLSAWILLFITTMDEAAAFFWLFIVPPLGAILLGLRWGFVLYLGIAAVNIYTGSLVASGNLTFPGLQTLGVDSWTVFTINFLTTNALITFPIGALLNGLVEGTRHRQKLEEDYQLLFNQNPQPMWVFNSETLKFLTVNQAAVIHYGYSEAEFLAMTILDVRPKEEFQKLKENLEEERRPRERSGPWKHRKKDGSLIYVEIISHGIEFLGQPARIVLADDVTEKVRADKEIRTRLIELESIRIVSEGLRVADRLEAMLPLMLDTALEALDLEFGSIWLHDPLSDLLSISFSRGYENPDGSAAKIPPESPGTGLVGKVFTANTPKVYVDFSREADLPSSIAEILPEGIGGIAVPIRADASPIGVFVVNTFAPRVATLEEVNLLTTMAEIAGSAIRRAQLYEVTQKSLRRLVALAEVNRAITANLDLGLTLERLVGQVVEQLDVDAADVLLLNEHLRVLEFAAGRGFTLPGFGRGLTLKAGQGFAGRVLAQRKLVHMRKLSPDDVTEEFAQDIRAEGFKTYVGLPLLAKGKLKGVLGIFHRADLDPDMEWLSFLNSLAAQASIAIDNASLVENLQRSNLDLQLAYDATIEGWSRAMDLRDRETEGHSQRVTELTLRLAQRMGIQGDALVHIRRGALLHDIGKMGIPDEILHKPGPLTDAEWQGMRLHPVYARDMLGSIEYLQKALDIPYAHHEKWDGSGYPRGLKGDLIPQAARIFAVVDVYDALTSDRPYRKAWTREKTLKYIADESGKHFDPEIVAAFLGL